MWVLLGFVAYGAVEVVVFVLLWTWRFVLGLPVFCGFYVCGFRFPLNSFGHWVCSLLCGFGGSFCVL